MSCRRRSSRPASFLTCHQKGSSQFHGVRMSPTGKTHRDDRGRRSQDIPRCSARPDRARARLAVAQINPSFPVETPFEGKDLRLAASGQEKQADSRRVKRAIRLVTVQDPGEATVFFGRKESLGSCLTIAADAPAGVAVLGAGTPGFRLLHDDGQDRRRAVHRGPGGGQVAAVGPRRHPRLRLHDQRVGLAGRRQRWTAGGPGSRLRRFRRRQAPTTAPTTSEGRLPRPAGRRGPRPGAPRSPSR